MKSVTEFPTLKYVCVHVQGHSWLLALFLSQVIQVTFSSSFF